MVPRRFNDQFPRTNRRLEHLELLERWNPFRFFQQLEPFDVAQDKLSEAVERLERVEPLFQKSLNH
jgi:hypothetical protein